MRISDWSSDVCSSDLELYLAVSAQGFEQNVAPQPGCGDEAARLLLQHLILEAQLVKTGLHRPRADCPGSYGLPCGLSCLLCLACQLFRVLLDEKIGRASCRERVCQYV